MQGSPERRPRADSANPSQLLSPSHRHMHTAGEFTPEVSPLDQLINRGRLLSKQIVHAEKNGHVVSPLSFQRSLRRLDTSSSRDRAQSIERNNGTAPASSGLQPFSGERPVEVSPSDERPVSSYPRFSTCTDTDELRSDRDSYMSESAGIRDSSLMIMGGPTNAEKNPPTFSNVANRHDSRHEFDIFGRRSLKPQIMGSLEEDAISPTSAATAKFKYLGEQDASRGRRADEEDFSSAPAILVRSRSQPPFSKNPQSRKPGERKFSAASDRQASDRQASDRQLPVREDSKDSDLKYIPYRKDSSASTNAPSSFGPLSRQGSAESGMFPPPFNRQDSGNSDRLQPYRTNSNYERNYYAPSRQGSGESDSKYIPYRKDSSSSDLRRPSRQDSFESDRGRVAHGRYSPQPTPSILGAFSPRALSPEPMDKDYINFGPPSAPLVQNPPRPFSPSGEQMVRSVSATSPRPPSSASDAPSQYSVGGTRIAPKPTFNFSRPLASGPPTESARPSLDIPRAMSPEPFSPIEPLTLLTPISMTEEPATISDGGNAPVPAYTYARYALPRGREPHRDSVVFQDSMTYPGQAVHPVPAISTPNPPNPPITPNPSYPTTVANPPTSPNPFTTPNFAASPAAIRPPSPNSPPRNFLQPAPQSRNQSSSRLQQQNAQPPRSAGGAPKPPHLAPSPASRGASPRRPSTANAATLAVSPAAPARTPQPTPRGELPPAASMSAEEHVQLGIDLHEAGSLQESTYHLRNAANAGHPTGMLLFALACRHGWGMRQNPKEGVMWLKKVTEVVKSEVEKEAKGEKKMDFMEKKGKKAQFALSVYELGVSHMNGWGTEVDKNLALSCFEIAGKWGDLDALSEAGFCYANGVGCKKDMKKSAKYYRMAEAKGVNMVGNSWIWKEKYLDDEDRNAKRKKEGLGVQDSDKGDKGKKEGGLFSRKKSVAQS
ncbi:hypothetical protein RUND412_005162 [Rhizina undulata]